MLYPNWYISLFVQYEHGVIFCETVLSRFRAICMGLKCDSLRYVVLLENNNTYQQQLNKQLLDNVSFTFKQRPKWSMCDDQCEILSKIVKYQGKRKPLSVFLWYFSNMRNFLHFCMYIFNRIKRNVLSKVSTDGTEDDRNVWRGISYKNKLT